MVNILNIEYDANTIQLQYMYLRRQVNSLNATARQRRRNKNNNNLDCLNKYERYYWTRKAPACLLALLCHYGKPRLCINIHHYAPPIGCSVTHRGATSLASCARILCANDKFRRPAIVSDLNVFIRSHCSEYFKHRRRSSVDRLDAENRVDMSCKPNLWGTADCSSQTRGVV